MKIVSTIKEVRDTVSEWKKQGLIVGFVPTMGYLHDGHGSLVKRSVEENDKTIVSIFVNPIQFAPGEDFVRYPRDLERDSAICESAGADLIFHPDRSEMYEENFSTFMDLTGPSTGLCAKTRPDHFRGVCTVVAKLFLITAPHKAYFGQKDAQQLAVITKMVRDMNFDVEVIGCPIVREEDGLAMSSRNSYLSPEERKAAEILNIALSLGRNLIINGIRESQIVKVEIEKFIKQEPLARIDYVDIVSFPDIKPLEKISGKVLTAIAVYIGKTRLIDNFILEV